jgi:hypothetical protein
VLVGQRAGAANLDHRIWAIGESQHLGEVGPGVGRRRRHARLHDPRMVDDEARVGMAIDEAPYTEPYVRSWEGRSRETPPYPDFQRLCDAAALLRPVRHANEA